MIPIHTAPPRHSLYSWPLPECPASTHTRTFAASLNPQPGAEGPRAWALEPDNPSSSLSPAIDELNDLAQPLDLFVPPFPPLKNMGVLIVYPSWGCCENEMS